MIKHNNYLGLRSILLTPIMDDRKWAKIPDIAADSFFVDLEDSLPVAQKEAGRSRAVEYLRQPGFFGGRVTAARPNGLSTHWGRDDIAALAEAGVTCVVTPMIDTAEEVLEYQELFRAGGADPDIFATIETPRATVEVEKIAQLDKVVALLFGVGDLSVGSGVPLLGAGGETNPAFLPSKMRTVMAAAAFGLMVSDIVFLPDVRDLEAARRGYAASRELGFTMGDTFYPPHIPIINELFGVSGAELSQAAEVIEAYEAAVAAGDPAVTLPTGRVLLIHDYHKALKVRQRAEAGALTQAQHQGGQD